MYAESTLAAIREAIGIEEVVGDYVQLKKSGQGYMGLCPFHGEKTPSFHVHPLKQVFHCFGCHKGGNIFTFLRSIEGITFPDAVQRLAKRAGITLEEIRNARPQQRSPVIENADRLYAALEWAAKYFNFLLVENKEQEHVREYIKRRGLTAQSIERFHMGVSPKGWNTLLTLMLKRGFTIEELIEAGLVVSKDDSPNKGYDRFRERLMFPIRDVDGRVIGFGARLLTDQKDQPKYLNSPESPLFSKRRVLYGLYENQRGIRVKGEAIVVEGYMDVVGLSEKGVANSVATMGTALTEEHCQALKPLTQKVLTVFDADAGGQEAWHRSVHIFLSSGFFARDLLLPDGKDPDEYVLARGAESFYALCEKAPRQITKLFKEIASQGALSEEESAKWLTELTPVLVATRKLPAADRALLWDDIALVLKVRVETLKSLSEGGAAHGVHKPERERQNENQRQPAHQYSLSRGPQRIVRETTPSIDRLDLEFMENVLLFPKRFKELLGLGTERPSQLVREASLKKPLLELEDAVIGSEAWDQILAQMIQGEGHPRLQAAVSRALVGASEESSRPDDSLLLTALYEKLLTRRREADIKALATQVRLSERSGNREEGLRLLEKLKELRAPLIPPNGGK